MAPGGSCFRSRPTALGIEGGLERVGPGGRVFQIAGREVWEVENGFDHTLISETGVNFDFDPAAFCAAFQ